MNCINAILWDYFFLPCVFICGALLTVRCGFVQFRAFRQSLKFTIGSIFKNNSNSVSPTALQAASTALASTIGTGNIVGTAQAIAMGGPGAVFWLWFTALFGMVIKYAEIYLSLKFRQKQSDGTYLGGPMYYIQSLGKAFVPLAWAYAFFAAVSAIGMGNMVQINSGVSAVFLAINEFRPISSPKEVLLRLILGILLAILVFRIISGGAKSVGKTAEILVPIMSVIFMFASITVLICHVQKLPQAINSILLSAFSPRAISGGAAGIGIREAMHWGIRRSAFSNEAGLGSSAIAHSSVNVENIENHSLWGIFEVFADTIVICTATALVILTSGVNIPWNSSPGPEMFKAALSTVFGDSASAIFMCLSMFSFAFATVIAWSLYGEMCIRYLFGTKYSLIYRNIYCSCVALACIMSTNYIWSIADLSNALMAIPNFIALFILSGKIAKNNYKLDD